MKTIEQIKRKAARAALLQSAEGDGTTHGQQKRPAITRAAKILGVHPRTVSRWLKYV